MARTRHQFELEDAMQFSFGENSFVEPIAAGGQSKGSATSNGRYSRRRPNTISDFTADKVRYRLAPAHWVKEFAKFWRSANVIARSGFEARRGSGRIGAVGSLRVQRAFMQPQFDELIVAEASDLPGEYQQAGRLRFPCSWSTR